MPVPNLFKWTHSFTWYVFNIFQSVFRALLILKSFEKSIDVFFRVSLQLYRYCVYIYIYRHITFVYCNPSYVSHIFPMTRIFDASRSPTLKPTWRSASPAARTPPPWRRGSCAWFGPCPRCDARDGGIIFREFTGISWICSGVLIGMFMEFAWTLVESNGFLWGCNGELWYVYIYILYIYIIYI